MAAVNKRYPGRTLVIPSLFLFISLFSLKAYSAGERVEGYRALYLPFRSPGGDISVALREFYTGGTGGTGGVKTFLTVNAITFETSLVEAGNVQKEIDAGVKEEELEGTPFHRAIKRYSSPPVSLRNHGVRRAEAVKSGGVGEAGGVFLTVDLCPSRKPFDRDLFLAASRLRGPVKRPVPINIAVSGGWILSHREEFAWIRGEENAGNISVTWINHSYSHPYREGVAPGEDFLLSPGVDFEKEVLDNEKLLLENGILPSPFFRFPGLISNEALVKRLKDLSLIPVGSGAWLARGEAPEDGSIILVHGNGNEPEGIRAALEFFRKNETGFGSGRINLLPIARVFAGTRGDK